MNNKYELTSETTNFIDHELHRIKSLSDFSNATKDSFGGYIEKEDNLSQEGDCWVYGNAIIYGNATVYGNAMIYNNAIVYGNAIIYGNATVYGNAMIYNNAIIYGNAIVCNNARVFSNAIVCNNAIVCGDTEVSGDAIVYDNARIFDNAKVFGNARVFGNAGVSGNASIGKNAYITSTNDYIVVGPIGSRLDYTTFYLDKNKNIYVCCGCYNGTIDEFKDRVLKVHKDNKYAKQYLSSIDYALSIFNNTKEDINE